MSKIEPYIYPQGKWMQQRAGSFTSSQIGNLFTEPKTKAAKEAGELSETAKTYIMDKAAELLTGTIRNTYTTPEMQWGIDNEPSAVEMLRLKGNPDLIYYGSDNPRFFIFSDFSGGSPDAVDDKTVFEVKCPNPRTHIEYLLSDNLFEMNKTYWYQLQMNMACVAREYDWNVMDMDGIFASYCPLMIDPKLRLKKINIKPDEEFQSKLPVLINNAENYLRSIISKFDL